MPKFTLEGRIYVTREIEAASVQDAVKAFREETGASPAVINGRCCFFSLCDECEALIFDTDDHVSDLEEGSVYCAECIRQMIDGSIDQAEADERIAADRDT